MLSTLQLCQTLDSQMNITIGFADYVSKIHFVPFHLCEGLEIGLDETYEESKTLNFVVKHKIAMFSLPI